MEQVHPSPAPAPNFVVKAEPIDGVLFDSKKYQYTIDLIGLDEIMISVFNSDSGWTYKTTIKKDSFWYKSNIYIFRDDFGKLLSILKDSLIKDIEIFKHKEIENDDILKVMINYENDVYPFTLEIDIPKHVSENGPLEDKVNILEYQIKLLRNKQNDTVKERKIKGKNKIYNEVNNLIYEGEIKDGKRNGIGVEYSSITGLKKYEGEFKDGYYDGEGTMYNDTSISQNMIYKAFFKKGVVLSKIENYGYNSDGDLYIQESFTFCADKQHSIGKQFFENEKVSRETNYRNGIKEGKEILYHRNNNKSAETNYKNGKKEGKEILYHQNSKVSCECNYRNDKREGKYTRFAPNGEISSEHNYVNGKQVGIQKNYNGYQTKGKKSWLQLEWETKDGENHGYYRQLDEGGKVISEQNYLDGELIS